MRPASCLCLAAIVLTIAPLASAAQAPPDSAARPGAAVSPDSADRIRASLDRPAARPAPDALDAATLPLRLLVLPLVAVGYGVTELVGLYSPAEVSFTDRYIAPLIRWGVWPTIGSFGPRSGFLGLRVQMVRYRPFYIDAGVSVRQSLLLGFGLDIPGENRNLRVGYESRQNPQLRFWGIGPNTPEDAESNYRGKRSLLFTSGFRRFGPLNVAGRLAFDQTAVGPGNHGSLPDIAETFNEDSLYGASETTKYARLDADFSLDLTGSDGYQPTGVLFELGANLFRGVAGTDSDYHQFRGRAVGYAPFNDRLALAGQLIFAVTRPDGGHGIPFYGLAQLGDDVGGRAYSPGRFSDRDLAALMVDWRFEIWRDIHERVRMESFIFVDVGGVAASMHRLSTSDLKPSYGFGWLFRRSAHLAFIAMLGFGDDGARFKIETKWPY